MISGRLGMIQRDQRGLTLVELLIAILLAGVVTGGITMTIFQVFDMNSRTSSHMTAIRQVQHAGKQVSQDLLQAKGVEPGGSSGFPLTLTWTDWDNNAQYRIVYTLENMPSGELKILQREHYVKEDGDLVFELDSTTKVAEYIVSNQTGCVQTDGAFTFTVTANVGGQSETRVYEVMPRSGSQ